MPLTPSIKRAVAFIDGQNLFRHAMDAFGHYHPNYDPQKLTNAVCREHGWINHGVRFYTGIPSDKHNPKWHGYWSRRLTEMKRAGIVVTSRPLRYGKDGSSPREKGIDLRIGLDVVRMARKGDLDVALIFSQDQDLAEVAQEIRDIAKSENKWLKIVSAYPSGRSATAKYGIYNTDWFPIDQTFYDACLDPRDYRPRPQ